MNMLKTSQINLSKKREVTDYELVIEWKYALTLIKKELMKTR